LHSTALPRNTGSFSRRITCRGSLRVLTMVIACDAMAWRWASHHEPSITACRRQVSAAKTAGVAGSAVLVQSMGLGIKALDYSANEAFADAQEAETEEVGIALNRPLLKARRFRRSHGAIPGLFPIRRKRDRRMN